MGNIFCSEAHNTDGHMDSPSISKIKAYDRYQKLQQKAHESSIMNIKNAAPECRNRKLRLGYQHYFDEQEQNKDLKPFSEHKKQRPLMSSSKKNSQRVMMQDSQEPSSPRFQSPDQREMRQAPCAQNTILDEKWEDSVSVDQAILQSLIQEDM